MIEALLVQDRLDDDLLEGFVNAEAQKERF